MLYFGSDKVEILYSKQYLTLNFLAVMLMLFWNQLLIPIIPTVVSIVLAVFFFIYCIPVWRSDEPKISQYNARYVSTVFLIIASVELGMFTSDREYFLTIPFIIAIVFGSMNSIFKSKILSKINILFMMSPLVKISMTYYDFEHLAVFSCISVMCIISLVLLGSTKEKIEKESELKAEFVKQVFKLCSNLTNHDLRNELSSMMVLSSKKYRENLPLFLNKFNECTSNILDHVSFNVFDNNPVNISDIISRMNHITNNDCIKFIYEAEDDINVFGNYNLIFSIIKNFIENAIEAAKNNGIMANIGVIKYGNTIEIIDDCGGFDVDKIMIGNSTKIGEGHGVFLSTMLDPSIQKMFGISVKILNINNGTRVIIKFS